MNKNKRELILATGELVDFFSPELSSRSRIVLVVEELLGKMVRVELTDTVYPQIITVHKKQLRKRREI